MAEEQATGYRVAIDIGIGSSSLQRVNPESPSGTRGLVNDRSSIMVRALYKGRNVTVKRFTETPLDWEPLGMSTGEFVPSTHLDQTLDVWRQRRRAERRRLVEAAEEIVLVQFQTVHVQVADPVHLEFSHPNGTTIVPSVQTFSVDGGEGLGGLRSDSGIIVIC